MLWVPWPTSYHRVSAKSGFREGKACADLVLILQSFTSYNLVFDFCIDKVATISFCHTLREERKWQHNTGEVQESFVFVPTQSDYMKMWEYLEELWKFENNFESHIVSFVGWNLNLQKILFEKQNLNDGTLWGNQLASENVEYSPLSEQLEVTIYWTRKPPNREISPIIGLRFFVFHIFQKYLHIPNIQRQVKGSSLL